MPLKLVSDAQGLIRRAIGLCPAMQHWPNPLLDELARTARLGQYRRHEQILAGDPQRREVFVVVSGSVAVDSVDVAGTRFLLTVFGPGDLMGLVRLLEGAQFVYDYHALEPTVLVRISSDAMRAALDAYPLQWRDVCLLALQRSHQQIIQQRTRTFSQLDRQLADVVVRLAKAQDPLLKEGHGFSVRVSQSDLAAMLSVSRQTINKELGVLEQYGLLRAEYGRLTLCDLPGLERLAYGSVPGAGTL